MAGEISFTLSEQDCVDAARAQYKHRVSALREWRFALPILGVMAGLVAYLTSCTLESAVYAGAGFAALVLLVCPLFAAAGYYDAGRIASRMFRQMTIHPESRISWTDEGIRNQNEYGAFTAKWGDFYGWRKAGGSYTIFLNEGHYYLIPHHSISSEMAVDIEETLARSGLAKR